jgi:hypothetical protein
VPIDLTTVPEGSQSPRRRRRRHHRSRKHFLIAIVGGISALAVFGIVFYIVNHSNVSMPAPAGFATGTRMDTSTVQNRDLTLKSATEPAKIVSAPPVSSGELSPDQLRAKITGVRRVIGADGVSELEVSYEFLPLAKPPRHYTMAVRTASNLGRITFPDNAPPTNVVRLVSTLERLGSRGPIDVWIETLLPANERVSNIMTIP